jgi:single-strand DNA-binding protein
MLIRLEFIGHLGKDATVNTVNGKNVINFNVANTQKWKDQQGTQHERTTWISCSYWVKGTAIAPYLLKGTQVFVSGEPSAEWYNANRNSADGIVAQLKCNVRELNLLGKGNSNGGNQQQGPRTGSSAGSNDGYRNAADITEPIDDLPF